MVNANELRIGNFVNRNDLDGLYSIRSVCIDRIHPINLIEHDYKKNVHYGCKCTLSKLEPIPLTPEILQQCGFGKIAEYNERSFFHTYKVEDFYISHCRRDTDGLKANSFLYHTGKKDIIILHFHQLQNLYFALTGEELIYKP